MPDSPPPFTSADLGFAGLLQVGYTPQEAYDKIRGECDDPALRNLLDYLRTTPEGRAALTWSRESWAQHGFSTPPWDA